MTKAELIKFLEPFSDEIDIYIEYCHAKYSIPTENLRYEMGVDRVGFILIKLC